MLPPEFHQPIGGCPFLGEMWGIITGWGMLLGMSFFWSWYPFCGLKGNQEESHSWVNRPHDQPVQFRRGCPFLGEM